jgi:general secretion pathway protein A
MYAKFFGLKQEPFSIAPDPRYLFMSERHREALAHLLYGVNGGGGFVLLSGEIGAGKTTVCRCFLEQIPRRCNVAYIFNPKLTVEELLTSVCEEFRIPPQHPGPGVATVKDYVDALNEYLLKTHAVGQNNVLIIDEAQNLSADVLEQLRLLTNLETSERKLLQIILIGQPELRDMLARPELEQLAQRVIARFHLEALSAPETEAYIRHRLGVAGLRRAMPFERKALERIHRLSRGVPRRINLLCDRALLGAYAGGHPRVNLEIVDKAAAEVFGARPGAAQALKWRRAATVGTAAVAGAALIGAVSWALDGWRRGDEPVAVAKSASSPAAAASGAASAASAASAPVVAKAASTPAAPDFTVRPVSLIRSEKDAWRELAQAWKVQLGEGDPCQAAQKQQLQCYRTPSINLALIRQLARPGIVTVHDEQGRPGHALLTGVTAQHATLRIGDAVHTVPLAVLADSWRGDFATFWRAPPGYRQRPAEGEAGAVVDWLAVQLAALRGEDRPAGRQAMNAALKARIHAFQLSQGLEADGLAGPMTFMQLNRATGVEEPRLATEK